MRVEVDVSFLKKRAQEFMEEGKRLHREGKYNLSAFHFEQALQLWLKYLIGLKTGDWPRTHYFSELLKTFSAVWESDEVLEFYKNHALFFSALEDAYFTARYFPKEFTQAEVEELLRKSEEFLDFTERITGEKFYR